MSKKPSYTIFDGMDFPPYEFNEYPKHLYTPDPSTAEGFTSVEVLNASDERALEGEWYASPTELRKARSAKAKPPAPSPTQPKPISAPTT